ncbi:MAG: hypothetical protein RQ736_01765 [Thiogranum sp.]|nr:hypothetical protein [Thiogranum sp.]
MIVKASGVGVLDAYLEAEVARLGGPATQTVFWDVDAPATLAAVHANRADPLRKHIPAYDMILTYGGGPPVVAAYEALGARNCVPVYNAVDPFSHYPVRGRREFGASLSFLGNRLPDREARVESFFFHAARQLPKRRFLLGGSGWETRASLPNVRVRAGSPECLP